MITDFLEESSVKTMYDYDEDEYYWYCPVCNEIMIEVEVECTCCGWYKEYEG